MSRYRVCVIGTLPIVLFALGATSRSALTDPVREARRDAVVKLCEKILDLHFEDQTTVRHLCRKSDTLKNDASPLIRGAMQRGLPRYDPQGSCVVSVSIETERVARNLREQFPDVTEMPGALDETKSLSATGAAPLAMTAGQPAPPGGAKDEPVRRVPGWADVPGRIRLRVERVAFERAVDTALAEARKAPIREDMTVGAFLEANEEAASAFRAALLDMRPLRKAYLAGGIVEVEFGLTAERLLDALKTVNEKAIDESKRLAAETLLAAKEKLAGLAESATGYASAAGQPIDRESLERTVAIEDQEMPRIEPKPLEAAE